MEQMATLSDHQESRLFSYERTWEEIEDMLDQAERKRNQWKIVFERAKRTQNYEGMKEAARNSKALEGVIKTLRWVLGEKGITNPLH